jgi:hypothetical protein
MQQWVSIFLNFSQLYFNGKILAAPSGCLKYYLTPSGVMKSFNFDSDKNSGYFNNLNYALCIHRSKNFCGI